MKINKNSWHYNMVEGLGGGNVPKNLCPYVRRLMFYILMIAFFIAFVLTGCYAIGSIAIGSLTSLTGIVAFVSSLLVGAIILAVFGGILFCIIFGGGHLIEKNKERKYRKLQGNYGQNKEPSLISSWIKAKHDKVCPVLEFEE